MERLSLVPADCPPSAGVDAFLQVAGAIDLSGERLNELARFIRQWGDDDEREILREEEWAVGLSLDPIDGDRRSAVLGGAVILALASEIMVRFWRRELALPPLTIEQARHPTLRYSSADIDRMRRTGWTVRRS